MADSQDRRSKRHSAERWTLHHLTVYVLSFVGYACYHVTRKTLSNVKKTMAEEWTSSPPNDQMKCPQPSDLWCSRHVYKDTVQAEYIQGLLDFLFMASYAVGLFFSGVLGDRIDRRKFLTFGMCASASCTFIFGTLTEWLHFYNTALYVVIWTVGGFMQSTGTPTLIAILANWFGKSSRGFLLGMWGSCSLVGNIIGALLAAEVLHYGYDYAFLVTSSILFAFGVITFFGLVAHPRELERIGLLSDEAKSWRESTESSPASSPAGDTPAAIGFCQALLLPGVIPYSLAHGAVKLVHYGFFFWLPLYLSEFWHEDVADQISIWYDVGGIIASTTSGLISDWMGLRSPVVVIMLVGGLPALYGYSVLPGNVTAHAILLSVVGLCIAGPASLIACTIAADLGGQGSSLMQQEALATVAGIIDGSGSIGAALGQPLVPLIQENFGWNYVFYFFMCMTALTVACILPVFFRELRTIRCIATCIRGTGRTDIHGYDSMGEKHENNRDGSSE